MPLLPSATENAMIAAGIVPTTTYYLSLHSATPGTTGANEISGGSYARQALAFGAASAGVLTSTDAQTFTNMPAESGGCPYFGIWSTSTGGTFLGGGTTSGLGSAISSGGVVSFAIAAVTCTLS